MVPPLPRNFGNAVLAGREVFPELPNVRGLRITAAQTDDRNVRPQALHRLTDNRIGRCGAGAPAFRFQRNERGIRIVRGGHRKSLRCAPTSHGAFLQLEVGDERIAMIVDKIRRQRIDSLVFKHQGLRQRAEGAFELEDQIQGQNRVNSVLLQQRICFNLIDPQLQFLRQNFLQIADRLLAQHRQRGVRTDWSLIFRIDKVRDSRPGLLARYQGCGRRLRHIDRLKFPAQRLHRDLRPPALPCTQQCLHSLRRLQFLDPAKLLICQRRCIHSHPAVCPERPVDRQRAATALAPIDQSVTIARIVVQEAIRKRIVALPQVPIRP